MPLAADLEHLLSSWKEIAAYLGKGVRTVQRWEHRFDLPIHRPSKAATGIVLAYRAELDQWARDAFAPSDDGENCNAVSAVADGPAPARASSNVKGGGASR